MKRIGVMLLVLGLLCVPFSAYALEVGVRGYYWFPELNGDVTVDEGGTLGTKIDFEDDLGMDDEDYPVVEAFVGLGDHHFSVSAMHIDYSGSETLTESITFKGEIYAVNENVKSTLQYDMIDAEYQYDVIDLENILAGFSVGVIGKVKWVDGEVEIKSTTTPTLSEKETFAAPIPMVGVGVHVGLIADILEARVKATGIGYSGNALYDVMGDISFTPFPFVDIHGGYRIIHLDVDVDDVELNYDMSGPYAAVTISF
jgi:outer membrane protein